MKELCEGGTRDEKNVLYNNKKCIGIHVNRLIQNDSNGTSLRECLPRPHWMLLRRTGVTQDPQTAAKSRYAQRYHLSV